MYILLISSTQAEIEATSRSLLPLEKSLHPHELDIRITGIGGMMTGYNLCNHIRRRRPDYIIQAGVAGSFSDKLPPGSAALIKEEIMADLGAEENDQFRDIFDLSLIAPHTPPFVNHFLPNPGIKAWEDYPLPLARGATVNAIRTSAAHTVVIREKYDPATESMEGAAFHYVCLMENIPFIQLRAISNYVGERDKKNWKLREAVDRLNTELAGVIQRLTRQIETINDQA